MDASCAFSDAAGAVKAVEASSDAITGAFDTSESDAYLNLAAVASAASLALDLASSHCLALSASS